MGSTGLICWQGARCMCSSSPAQAHRPVAAARVAVPCVHRTCLQKVSSLLMEGLGGSPSYLSGPCTHGHGRVQHFGSFRLAPSGCIRRCVAGAQTMLPVIRTNPTCGTHAGRLSWIVRVASSTALLSWPTTPTPPAVTAASASASSKLRRQRAIVWGCWERRGARVGAGRCVRTGVCPVCGHSGHNVPMCLSASRCSGQVGDAACCGTAREPCVRFRQTGLLTTGCP